MSEPLTIDAFANLWQEFSKYPVPNICHENDSKIIRRVFKTLVFSGGESEHKKYFVLEFEKEISNLIFLHKQTIGKNNYYNTSYTLLLYQFGRGIQAMYDNNGAYGENQLVRDWHRNISKQMLVVQKQIQYR